MECGNPNNNAIISNWLATASADDICDQNISVTNDYPGTSVAGCGDTEIQTVTFTAVDACMNMASCTATISFVDTQSPVLQVAAKDTIVECDGAGNTAALTTWLTNMGGAIASDDCDQMLDWTNSISGSIPGCGSNGTTRYIFTATDDCGNSTTTVANFTIEDTTPPVINPPSDLVVTCDGLGNTTELAGWLNGATGVDICESSVGISNLLFNTISGCGGAQSLVYQFTATDACGNSSTGLATFTIQDAVDPMITCPANLVLECGNAANTLLVQQWLISATGVDACSDFTITTDYNGTLPANCGGTLPVIFTVSDECGNSSSCTSNIILNDTQDPFFINCPADITLNVDAGACTAIGVFPTPVALDNCDNNVTTTLTGGIASGGLFPIGDTPMEFTASG